MKLYIFPILATTLSFSAGAGETTSWTFTRNADNCRQLCEIELKQVSETSFVAESFISYSFDEVPFSGAIRFTARLDYNQDVPGIREWSGRAQTVGRYEGGYVCALSSRLSIKFVEGEYWVEAIIPHRFPENMLGCTWGDYDSSANKIKRVYGPYSLTTKITRAIKE